MTSTKNSNLFFSNNKSPKNFSYKNKEDTYKDTDEDDIYIVI